MKGKATSKGDLEIDSLLIRRELQVCTWKHFKAPLFEMFSLMHGWEQFKNTLKKKSKSSQKKKKADPPTHPMAMEFCN